MYTQFTKTKLFTTLFLALTVFLFAACSPAGGTEPAASDNPDTGAVDENPTTADIIAELTGPIWLLQEMSGQAPAANAQPTLEFTADGIAGTTGCNSYFGQVGVEDGRLTIGQIGMTEMYCDGVMEQEQAYLALLQSVTGYTLADDMLTLQTADGDLVYSVAQDSTLEGPTWILGGIAQDDAVVSTWIDTDIHISFVDGTVSGNSGCNSFSGTYTLDGETITFGPLMSTLMACAEDERNEREAEFLAALNEVASFSIKRETLTLADAEGNMLMSFNVAMEQPETSTGEEVTMFVGAEKVECVGVGPQECLQVKWSADGDWELFYDQIVNFEWTAGYEYELRVRITEIDNPPADASSLQYELLTVISQTPAN